MRTRAPKMLFLTFLLFAALAFAGDLPDARLTPGAVNPNLSDAQFYDLCRQPDWTRAFRPPVWFTGSLKRKQLAAGYGGATQADPDLYEEDHLIPLCLGGAPRDERNLWPQLWAGEWGAHKKDTLEKWLCRRACAHEIDLAQARREIAADWIAAYKKYIGS